jgi:nucleoside-diphosphate-sugar epimerase
MGQKVLVTGGAGFIGSVLTRELLSEGYEVTVLDSFKYGQNSLLDCCANDNFTVIRGDVRDKNRLATAMQDAEFIIHLAALVGAPACDRNPVEANTTNVEATKLLLSLRKQGQKILYPCTNSGYGIGEKDKYCTESTPMRPVSLYGKNKVEAETIILQAGDSISLRLATVFGASPRMRTDLLVNDFVYRALTDRYLVVFEGHFRRNYLHIRDAARAFLHMMRNFSTLKNQVYNVGLSDANISKLDLCARIKKQIPDFYYVESAIGEDPDKRDYIVSNEKIERTGFKPSHSLDYGVRELIKAYTITGKTTASGYVNA